MDILKLSDLILKNENVLMEKVLLFAKKLGYSKYTSTLIEAWRKSVCKLSNDFAQNLMIYEGIPELSPDDDYAKHPIASYGVFEAISHRTRGVNLSMFLGLMKYYCQSYVDLINESELNINQKQEAVYLITRYFDYIELGFITEWTGLAEEYLINELQDGNRLITNEKNKYLTVFESIYDPVILFNEINTIININSKAVELFLGRKAPGSVYYNKNSYEISTLDWLIADVENFSLSKEMELNSEKHVTINGTDKSFMLKFKKMLDVSEKYAGTVVILNDITERIMIESTLKSQQMQLERYAYTDPLTGISNRRTGYRLMEEAFKNLTFSEKPLCLCYIDIDGLKKVNDTYGHIQGDDLINFIVATIQNSISVNDHLIRMGGDEFIILFLDRYIFEATKIVLKIERILEEFDQRKLLPYNHSFSYGIIELNAGTDSNIVDAIREADEKMYANKLSKKIL